MKRGTIVYIFLIICFCHFHVEAQTFFAPFQGIRHVPNPRSKTFTNKNALQTFTVPDGISIITITAKGGDGGNASYNGSIGYGGRALRVTATYSNAAGKVFSIKPGAAGGSITVTTNSAQGVAGGGGGGSFVTLNGTYLDVLVAGGGGGGVSGFMGTENGLNAPNNLTAVGGPSESVYTSATPSPFTQSPDGGYNGGQGFGGYGSGAGYWTSQNNDGINGGGFDDFSAVPRLPTLSIYKGYTSGGMGGGGAGVWGDASWPRVVSGGGGGIAGGSSPIQNGSAASSTKAASKSGGGGSTVKAPGGLVEVSKSFSQEPAGGNPTDGYITISW